MKENQVSPQLIIYDQKDARLYLDWLKSDILLGKKFALLYVAGKGDQLAQNPISAINKIISMSENQAKSWMLCGFEKLEPKTTSVALSLGGHVRIGFENNIHQEDGVLALNNQEQVQNVVNSLPNNNRHLADYDAVVSYLTPDW